MSHHLLVRVWYIRVQSDRWCVWPCWRLLLFMTRAIRFFLFPFLFPSFIPGSVGSYYPSWNDFNRDTAIPMELFLPTATQSIANWPGLWFIENPLLWRNSYTHTHKHTNTGNSPSVAHDVLGLRLAQFRAASATGRRCTIKSHWELHNKDCSPVVNWWLCQ